MGGHIRGVVTQWQPPKKLIYTWNVFNPGNASDAVSAYPESYPTFELEGRGSDVLLTRWHRRAGRRRGDLIGVGKKKTVAAHQERASPLLLNGS